MKLVGWRIKKPHHIGSGWDWYPIPEHGADANEIFSEVLEHLAAWKDGHDYEAEAEPIYVMGPRP